MTPPPEERDRRKHRPHDHGESRDRSHDSTSEKGESRSAIQQCPAPSHSTSTADKVQIYRDTAMDPSIHLEVPFGRRLPRPVGQAKPSITERVPSGIGHAVSLAPDCGPPAPTLSPQPARAAQNDLSRSTAGTDKTRPDGAGFGDRRYRCSAGLLRTGTEKHTRSCSQGERSGPNVARVKGAYPNQPN